jgi:glycosyltransferase involved in cell wall biosynthesis
VLSEVLGNRTYSAELRSSLERQFWGELSFASVTPVDLFARGVMSRISSVHAAIKAGRQKITSAYGGHDGILLFGWEFLLSIPTPLNFLPVIAGMDSTPALIRGVGPAQTPWLKRVPRHILRVHYDRCFSAATTGVCAFMPVSEWCASSLIRHYGVSPDRVSIAHIPIDLERWRPAQGSRQPRLRLLFVGNDFVRKGGVFLLDLFRRHLSSFCSLTIVSHDRAVGQLTLPDGVRWLGGVERDSLPDTFRSADIFVFPTEFEAYGYVLAEAAASGVPSVAKATGGVPSAVCDGVSGIVLSEDSTMEQWAHAIKRFHTDRLYLEAMSRSSRKFAVERHGRARFDQCVCYALDRLLQTNGSR